MPQRRTVVAAVAAAAIAATAGTALAHATASAEPPPVPDGVYVTFDRPAPSQDHTFQVVPTRDGGEGWAVIDDLTGTERSERIEERSDGGLWIPIYAEPDTSSKIIDYSPFVS